jgi:hypothetical protein
MWFGFMCLRIEPHANMLRNLWFHKRQETSWKSPCFWRTLIGGARCAVIYTSYYNRSSLTNIVCACFSFHALYTPRPVLYELCKNREPRRWILFSFVFKWGATSPLTAESYSVLFTDEVERNCYSIASWLRAGAAWLTAKRCKVFPILIEYRFIRTIKLTSLCYISFCREATVPFSFMSERIVHIRAIR